MSLTLCAKARRLAWLGALLGVALCAAPGCSKDDAPRSSQDEEMGRPDERDCGLPQLPCGSNQNPWDDMDDMRQAPDDGRPSPDMADMARDADMTSSPDMATMDMGPSGQVVYHQHVKPILAQACVGCHSAGQIGPFELDTYAKAKPLAAAIEAAVDAGTMPPWLPKDQCGDFSYKRALTPTQIQTLKRWVAAGAPEGDPSATPEAQPPYEQVQLGQPSLVVDTGTDYVPRPPAGKTDDYRCFVVEPGLTKDEFISAVNTRPGNAATVHHMLLFSVPRAEKSKLDQLSAAQPEAPGYTCFGGPKVNNTLLAVWAPGVVPVKFPAGYGIPVKRDELLVIQVHYNTINDQGPDRTSIDLHFTQGPTRKLAMLPVADQSLNIAPGDANAVEGTTYNLPNLPITLKLFGVVPHMHARGKSISVKLTRAGQEQCLIDIPRWDFNWQNVYLYKTPIEVRGGDSIKLECVYDNSPERNRELGLNGPPAQPITWGEDTLDEMCLNYVILEDIRP